MKMDPIRNNIILIIKFNQETTELTLVAYIQKLVSNTDTMTDQNGKYIIV